MSIFIGTDSHFIQGKKSFPVRNFKSESFQFGLEAEFFLADIKTWKPLWYKDLTFKKLNSILEKIPFKDVGGRVDLFSLEEPSKKISPYVIEGYHVVDKDYKVKDLLPKGVEIRTPVFETIEGCLKAYKILFERMQKELKEKGLVAVSLSHHPTEDTFKGPQNKRRHDYWQWAMEVMSTYGPDINISVPTKYLVDFNEEEFLGKVDYFSPAMAAVSACSTFFKNSPCKSQGHEILSLRTHKRSVIAPPIELHGDEENRFEFKVFEMSPYLEDFHCFYLLFLTLILDTRLEGRSDKATRIYELGEASRLGLQSKKLRERLLYLLNRGPAVLGHLEFDLNPLEKIRKRIEKKETLSDELLSGLRRGNSMESIFKFLSKVY
ncbi:MAG: glutamate-cysteine ligase family protein [Bdellovibrionota bacterium]|nr:glutamate-cysteine ligase family protein [Bdellovibrionota bacterium]